MAVMFSSISGTCSTFQTRWHFITLAQCDQH